MPEIARPVAIAGNKSPKLPKRLFSLRISTLSLTVATILVTALAIHLPWLFISKANARYMAEQISAEILKGVRVEVKQVFDMARADQRTIAGLFTAKVLDLTDVKKRESVFLAYLKGNPNYSFVALGLDNGDFLGAERKSDSIVATISSTYNNETKTANREENIYVADGENFTFARKVIKENDYNATSRAWYKQAKAAPNTEILTDPYIFANSGKVGVNTARTLQINEKTAGVINIAIELNHINDYLQGLTIGINGSCFLLGPNGEVLAFKNTPTAQASPEMPFKKMESGAATTSGSAPMTPISNASHPLLKIVSNAIQSENISLKDLKSIKQLYFENGGSASDGYFVTLAPSGENGWVIGTVVPQLDFTAHIVENIKLISGLIFLVVLVCCAVAVYLTQRLFINPLNTIIAQTRLVKNFELAYVVTVDTRINEIHLLSSSIHQMAHGLSSFGKFIPLSLVKLLLAQGVRADVSGENRTLSIFFMDMVSFTTISEEMGPKLLPHLGRYMSQMSDIVARHEGTIDKYIGDAIMAFWGAPLYNEDHALACCRAAVECVREVEVLRKAWPEKFREHFGVRIGVNTGRVIVGNIGSSSRLNYTVLGDPVNLAARLESAGKDYGVACIIGLNTYELTRYDIVSRKLDVLTVKGKLDAVPIYELLDMADTEPTEDYGWIKVFEEGLALYFNAHWLPARACFERTIALRGKDSPSEVFIKRCEAHINALALHA